MCMRVCVCHFTGERMLKAREGIKYGRGEDQSIETLKTKFDEYCPGNNPQSIPYEANPFFTCVERAGMCPDVSISQSTDNINNIFIV